jgi:hypothetical protein
VDAKDWIALAGVFSTASISIVTVLANRRRERQQQERDDRLRSMQQERDDRLRSEQQQREDRLLEKERSHAPHIVFVVDCRFHGPTDEEYVVECVININNKGRIRQEVRNLSLRMRGIDKGQRLTYWGGHGRRLEFPDKIVDEKQLAPVGTDYYFVEPGINQSFVYVTKIPSDTLYVLTFSRFDYDAESFHTTERLFAVSASGGGG